MGMRGKGRATTKITDATNFTSPAQMAIRESALNTLGMMKPAPMPVREVQRRREEQKATVAVPLLFSTIPAMFKGFVKSARPEDSILPIADIATGVVASPSAIYATYKAGEGAIKWGLRRMIERSTLKDLARVAREEAAIEPAIVVENPLNARYGRGRATRNITASTDMRSEAQRAIRETALNKLAAMKPPRMPIEEWGARRARQKTNALLGLFPSAFSGTLRGIASLSTNDTSGLLPALDIMTGATAVPTAAYGLYKGIQGALNWRKRRMIEEEAEKDLARVRDAEMNPAFGRGYSEDYMFG
jgi:hypothetical protein